MTAVLVIGAGAIGTYLSSRLVEAGHDVSLIARGPRADLLRHQGVTVEQDGKRTSVAVCVETTLDQAARPEVALMCTKGCDLPGALDLLETIRTRLPAIVTLQNGVEAPEQVLGRFEGSRVLAGRMHGFFEADGSVVRHVGVTPSIVFGGWNDQSRGSVNVVAELFTSAHIENSISRDIRADIWEKFLLAAALGGVGAALSLPAGKVLHSAVGAEMLEAAMREIAELARLRVVGLPDRCVEAALAFVSGFPADATTSLQRDLLAGKPSEFDQLTGAVIRLADECGLEVPVHKAIAKAIVGMGLLKRMAQQSA